MSITEAILDINYQSVIKLGDEGVDFNILIDDDISLLHLAILELPEDEASIMIFKYLCDRIDVNHRYSNSSETCLHTSIFTNKLVFMREILNHHPNLEAVDEDDQTVMHLCIIENKNNTLIEIINSIKDRGELNRVINIKDSNGNSLLHYCVKYNNLESLNYLITTGANVLATNNQGNTIIHESIIEEAKEILVYLLKYQDLLVKCNNRNQSPLHLAIQYKRLYHFSKILNQLKDNKVDIFYDTSDIKGNTLLNYSILYDCRVAFGELLEKSNIYHLNSNNQSPFELCIIHDQSYQLNKLIGCGFDINHPSISKDNIIKLVCQYDRSYILKYLISIEHSIIVSRDASGFNALDYSIHKVKIPPLLLTGLYKDLVIVSAINSPYDSLTHLNTITYLVNKYGIKRIFLYSLQNYEYHGLERILNNFQLYYNLISNISYHEGMKNTFVMHLLKRYGDVSIKPESEYALRNILSIYRKIYKKSVL